MYPNGGSTGNQNTRPPVLKRAGRGRGRGRGEGEREGGRGGEEEEEGQALCEYEQRGGGGGGRKDGLCVCVCVRSWAYKLYLNTIKKLDLRNNISMPYLPNYHTATNKKESICAYLPLT